MLLTEYHDVVQAVAPDRAYQPLRIYGFCQRLDQTDLERCSTVILTSLPQTMTVCAAIPAEYFMLEPVRQGSAGNPQT
jgi:hypothetical protein